MFSYCLFMCVRVCLFIRAITFECRDIETSFLAWWYTLAISRSSLSTKVIGQGQGHFCKIGYLTVRHQILLLYSTYGINMIIKVKVILRSRSFQNQVVSVCISILKQEVGLPPNAFSFTNVFKMCKKYHLLRTNTSLL